MEQPHVEPGAVQAWAPLTCCDGYVLVFEGNESGEVMSNRLESHQLWCLAAPRNSLHDDPEHWRVKPDPIV